MFGYFRVSDIVVYWPQIVDPGDVHIFMQQDALRAVNLVECKSLRAMESDDVFQVWKLSVVEKCRAERYTRGLRKAVSLLDVATVCTLGDVLNSLYSCRLVLSIAAHSSDGPIALRRSGATYPQRGDPFPGAAVPYLTWLSALRMKRRAPLSTGARSGKFFMFFKSLSKEPFTRGILLSQALNI